MQSSSKKMIRIFKIRIVFVCSLLIKKLLPRDRKKNLTDRQNFLKNKIRPFMTKDCFRLFSTKHFLNFQEVEFSSKLKLKSCFREKCFFDKNKIFGKKSETHQELPNLCRTQQKCLKDLTDVWKNSLKEVVKLDIESVSESNKENFKKIPKKLIFSRFLTIFGSISNFFGNFR